MKPASRIPRRARLAIALLAAVLAGPASAQGAKDPFAALDVQRLVAPPPAPDVVFRSLEGVDRHLGDLRGKVVLLGFFTTWRPNCRREAPAKASLYERFRTRGLEMVGISLGERPDAVRGFASEFGIRFPLWIDPEGRGPAAFGVLGHPNTILIDRQGRVVGRVRGERDWGTDEARRLVELLLGSGP